MLKAGSEPISLPSDLPSIAWAADAYLRDASDGRPPRQPGVYGFWSGDVCLYIGQSRNLAKRILRSHERKREFPGCRVRWLVCANHIAVERWLIRALAPQGNGHTRETRERWERAQREHDTIPLETRFERAWTAIFGADDFLQLFGRHHEHAQELDRLDVASLGPTARLAFGEAESR